MSGTKPTCENCRYALLGIYDGTKSYECQNRDSATFLSKLPYCYTCNHFEPDNMKETAEETELAFYAVHDLKTLPKYFEAVITGEKTFEVRLDDRNFQVGDVLHLREYDNANGYTGRHKFYNVTYILSDTEYVKDGYVILGLSRESYRLVEE